MKIFLVSDSIIGVRENGVKVRYEIDENNSFADNLGKCSGVCYNFLFICNNKRTYAENDDNAKMMCEAFRKSGFPFERYDVLDKRTQNNAKSLIEKADIIFIQGGTLPGQLKFLKKIKFAEHIKNSKAAIVGKSAGAMNLGNTVYAFPESKLDRFRKRYLKGLGFYDYIVIPHFNKDKNGYEFDVPYNLLDDYFIPDSKDKKFYALPQGSYIFLDDDKHYLFGEGYLIENGNVKKICNNEESLLLNK